MSRMDVSKGYIDAAMRITSSEFQTSLGAEISAALGGQYRFFKSRLEFRADAPDGHNVLILAGATKYSPHISIDFYFGRNFAEAKHVEKLLGKRPCYYHISQFSVNRESMRGLEYKGPYSWCIDISDPPKALVFEVVAAFRGIAVPFFERFASIQTARDAIAADDPWCFSGGLCWRQLLLLDMALNDLNHFERWRTCLDDLAQGQATEMIALFKKANADNSKPKA